MYLCITKHVVKRNYQDEITQEDFNKLWIG